MDSGALASLLGDLEQVHPFVAAQPACGQSESDVIQVQFEAFCARFRGLEGKITVGQATQLTMAISNGPWTPAHKVELTRIVNASQARGVSRVKRRNLQECLHFEQYLTEAEWASLNSDAMRMAKIQQIAARAWSIGITCPGEPTLMRMLALLAYVDKIFAPDDFIAAKNDLRRAVKTLDAKRAYPHTHLENYPYNPAELPMTMFQYAYVDGTPKQVHIPQLDTALGHTRMRTKMSADDKALTLLKRALSGCEPSTLQRNVTPRRDLALSSHAFGQTGLGLVARM